MVYQDKNASIEERVQDLLSRMTLDEKLDQLDQDIMHIDWEKIEEPLRSECREKLNKRCGDKSGAPRLHWELKELYVDPFFQHQGLGQALIREFLSSAVQVGMKTASLWVLEKNLSARDLYSRFGFAPNGVRKLQEGTSEYLLEYWKTL